jgi:hypothetical protein
MKKFIYYIVAAVVFTACTENIDLPLKSQGTHQLVVEGQITTDTTAHWVRLSYSSDYYDRFQHMSKMQSFQFPTGATHSH